MTESLQKKLNEKLNRIQSAVDKKVPDRIPVLPYMDTWMMHYANIGIKKAFTEDPEYLFQSIKKFTDDFYVDALMGVCNIIPIKVLNNFGKGLYVVTDEGLQIVGGKGHTMKDDEYGLLAQDPYRFVANNILPRKYPKLSENPAETTALLEKGFADLAEFKKYNGVVAQRIETELGIPNLPKATCFVTPDIILDYLRDFVGVSSDIRRRPNDFLRGAESLLDWTFDLTFSTYKTPEDRKGIVFSPLHLPTFLKPKDFEKFYFPFMKKMVEELSVKRGYTILYYMENQWEPYLDIMQDLPDAKVIGMFEHGDLAMIKNKIGSKMTIAGGLKANILRYGTVQQCVDNAKECIDKLGPGGNYIFSVDMILMNLSDAKPENLRAALEYVHVNGKY